MEETEKRTKHGIKQIVSAVITFCLIALVFLTMVIVVKTTLADDPSVFGYRFFYIITGSMEPAIPVGSAVVTKKQAAYTVGDVITFESMDTDIMGMPNTHRITALIKNSDGTYYQTKGDANELPDELLVPFDDVYGKVILITPPLDRLGTFLEFLFSPTGILILLVIPMMLITVFCMKNYTKSCRADLAEKIRLQEEAKMANPTMPEQFTTHNTKLS